VQSPVFSGLDEVVVLSIVVLWVVTPCGPVGEDPTSSVFSPQKEEASDTLVPTYKSKWRHNPEDHQGHLHRRENLKF
jgi:hypothetical protein